MDHRIQMTENYDKLHKEGSVGGQTNTQPDVVKQEHRIDDQPQLLPPACSSHKGSSSTASTSSSSWHGGCDRDPDATAIRAEICRICHLGKEIEGDEGSDDQAGGSIQSSQLTELGCACKDELGISHYQCAHAWFTLKGNRTCEVCGQPAKNIHGIEDQGMRILGVESIRDRSTTTAIIRNLNRNPSTATNGSTSSQMCVKSSCNVLMTCLFLAFFVPWLFGVHKLW